MRSEAIAGDEAEVLWPAWAASARVGALMSTRRGGVSVAPWDSLNLGTAVGDVDAAVAENRRRFAAMCGARPVWLRQVHGREVVRASSAMADADPVTADAAWTDEPHIACTVQVADCMPVLLAAPEGRAVAAAHAGWRGLAGGVLEATIDALCAAAACAPADVEVWLGPSIGPRQFEVGAEVLQAFGQTPEQPDPECFVERAVGQGPPRWLANLPQLARQRLARAGVRRIAGGEGCTVEQRSRFFSYRRDRVTGRMAAAVWIRG
jgi:YfiH family protein